MPSSCIATRHGTAIWLPQMAILLISLFLWTADISAIKIEHLNTRDWNNSKSYPPIQPLEGAEGTYKVMMLSYNTTNQTTISSDNGNFCLAVYEFTNSPGQFYLTVVLGCNSTGAGIPVWIGNRDSPATVNYTLLYNSLTSFQYYVFYDGLGRRWSGKLGLDSAELQNSGNWVHYNSTGGILWQSFEHPTDALVAGQVLKSASRLVSRSTAGAPGSGSFTAMTNEDDRFVSNLNVSNIFQPYYASSFSSGCSSGEAMVTYTTDHKLQLSYNSSLCSTQVLRQFNTIQGMEADTPSFMRLESDGNFVSYTLGSSGWEKTSMISDRCDLPLVCGKYGICSGKGICHCLTDNDLTVDNGSLTIATNSNGTCTALNVSQAPCDQNLERNNHFIPIKGRYFTNSYTTSKQIKLDACKESCLSNCSCNAYFYSNGSCITVDDILGSFKEHNMTQGYLKFRNDNLKTGALPSNRRLLKAIIGGLIGAALLLSIMAVILVKVMRRKPKDLFAKEIDKCIAGIEGLPPRFTYKEVEEATDNFSLKLGSGGFGSVYEGMLPNGKKVAVKRLEATGAQGIKQFVAEVASMANIGHVNIVKLCGFCIENADKMLIYEFMQNKSLDQWLFGEEKENLSWKLRMSISLGMARGLAYLHEECSEPIIHLDVKPQNILLDEKFVAKVADFGMAKQVERDESHVVTCVRGTPGYLAPEWLMHSLATKKCDVYSFGMVLLELIGGRRNLEVLNIGHELSWYFPAWAVNEVGEGKYMNLIDSAVRHDVPEAQGKRIIQIALWCIQEDSSMRPAMDEVVQMLEGVRTVDDPPLSFHFAVPTQTIVSFNKSKSNKGVSVSYMNTESVSMAYVNPPTYSQMSSLIR